MDAARKSGLELKQSLILWVDFIRTLLFNAIKISCIFILFLFSALTVRYLTRRYIGEYRSNTGK